jgi:hypothetical protein
MTCCKGFLRKVFVEHTTNWVQKKHNTAQCYEAVLLCASDAKMDYRRRRDAFFAAFRFVFRFAVFRLAGFLAALRFVALRAFFLFAMFEC